MCNVTVTITDDEAPVLQSCATLNVAGTTDTGEAYGTMQAGSVTLVYPTVSDNSGENLTVVALVGGSAINSSYPFPYVGATSAASQSAAVSTMVTYSVTDSSSKTSTCTVTVTVTAIAFLNDESERFSISMHNP